ncbi:endolytic transglycosylase MltG [Salisediminibacterium selenitireducens]|uniref:Aminodeoxychorismate lyase n=1 Tax=Bacillus selenitireducens (strain ATCC 700615 / DSM 15326 / MLS10) TaxID=439292 RepID=D6XWT6_BACIE|nr:endolytic transglycosylase MltG [Salisediminibacterium selenitireducens]ADH99912.1 hypothetical protein Bsel_2410 [[Bacillus] selenitireducens MLS10]
MTKDQLKGIGTGILLATALLIPSVMADSQETQSDDTESHDTEQENHENTEADNGMSDEDWQDYQNLIEDMYVIEEALKAADEQNKSLKEKNEALEEALEEERERSNETADESVEISALYLVVGQGMSAGEIGEILERAGMIPSSSSFRQYIEDEDLVMSIRAGEYVITETMSVQDIASEITS